MKVPEGAKCDECGHVNSQGFSWMTWTGVRQNVLERFQCPEAVIEGVQNQERWRRQLPTAERRQGFHASLGDPTARSRVELREVEEGLGNEQIAKAHENRSQESRFRILHSLARKSP